LGAKKKARHHAARQPVPRDLLLASGVKAQRTGDATAAERAFRRVLGAYPDDEQATQFLGALLVDRGELDEALELFERVATTLGPPTEDTFGFYNNYANALRRAGRLPSAEETLRQLVAIAPREWQPWHNLGQTLKDLERYDEAAAALRRAVLLEPDFGPNHGVLGEVLHNLGRLHSADASLRRCLDMGWTSDHAVWTILGNNQRLLGKLDDALDMVNHALALSGGHPGAYSNVGVVLTQLGRFDEAVENFHKALELDPENNGFHGYLGYALLAAGRIDEATEHWERGIQGGPRGKERNVEVPRWTPADVDTRVLVYREQGVGDEIMLASMYPDLLADARDVIIECDTRLVPLFTRSFPAAEVRAQTLDVYRRETAHDFERALAAGSLMQFYRLTLDAFVDHGGFLVPDAERVAFWRNRLAELGPPPYTGISWRSKIQTAERRLEYTRLDEWDGIFGVADVTWVNLQYDDCDRELRDAEDRFGVRIHRWDELDLMNDFDEIAALTTALDLVVAPFNAVSMLSGALGVRTIIIGRRFGWSELGTGRLPWLPSITLALQTPSEEWDDALALATKEVSAAVDRTATRV
jgi:tetratricopeptide (TPR) repeat protein